MRDFERSYQFLCHWSHIELEASKNDGLYIALNIGDYRFEGCGHTLNEAKIDAIKKFYSSSVNNFFEISEEKNETKSVLENTPSKDQINSSHCANTKSSGKVNLDFKLVLGSTCFPYHHTIECDSCIN